MLRVAASSRAALRLHPPARRAKGLCSLTPLHQRVEVAAARGDLDECRRLLAHDPRALPSVVAEVERARDSGARRVATQAMGALTGYWLWNAAAWAYAYRVLGAEAERVLADRDHQGIVEIELHMKSFSPRGETRSPPLPDERAEREPDGGGAESAIIDSPYRAPVEPRRVLVPPPRPALICIMPGNCNAGPALAPGSGPWLQPGRDPGPDPWLTLARCCRSCTCRPCYSAAPSTACGAASPRACRSSGAQRRAVSSQAKDGPGKVGRRRGCAYCSLGSWAHAILPGCSHARTLERKWFVPFGLGCENFVRRFRAYHPKLIADRPPQKREQQASRARGTLACTWSDALRPAPPLWLQLQPHTRCGCVARLQAGLRWPRKLASTQARTSRQPPSP